MISKLIGMLGTGFITSIITSWLNSFFNRRNSMKKCRPILNVKTLENKSVRIPESDPEDEENELSLCIPYSLKIENLSKFDCYNVMVKAEIEINLGYGDFDETYHKEFDYSAIKSGEIRSIDVLRDIAEDIALKNKKIGASERNGTTISDRIDKVDSYKIKNLSVDFNSQELEKLRYEFKPANDYEVGNLNWENQEHYKPKTIKDTWYKITDKINELRIFF